MTTASSIPTNHESNASPTPSSIRSGAAPVTCPLCCEEDTALVLLSTCHHQSCDTCFVKWINREEASGRTARPTCPFFRADIDDGDILRVMGRPFHPRMGQADAVREATNSEDEIDELTLHWIKQNTMLCRVSGNRVERSEGCDHMECLCGHQFCNRCGEAYVACLLRYRTQLGKTKSQLANSSILSHIQEVEQKISIGRRREGLLAHQPHHTESGPYQYSISFFAAFPHIVQVQNCT